MLIHGLSSSDGATLPLSTDDYGRAQVCMDRGGPPRYRLFIPPQSVGSSKVYFDLFVAEPATGICIRSVNPVVSGTVAVTGVLTVDLHLTRTTDVGTGGTAATSEDSSLTAISFSRYDLNDIALPTGITARAAPAGGATAGAVLSMTSVMTEETNAGIIGSPLWELVNRNNLGSNTLTVRPGTGIRVVQGGITSVGRIGFDVVFSLI